MSYGRSPSLSLRALMRVTALVAEGLAEERLMPLLARCTAEGVAADTAAVYVLPDIPRQRNPVWRLSGHHGADAEVLAGLPVAYGRGGGILAPLFQGARDMFELDVLDGAPADADVPARLPVRSLVGVPVRRRDGRPIGALLVGARRAGAFDEAAHRVIRSIGNLLGIGLDNARLAADQQRERRMAAESAVTLGTVLESVSTGVCVVELDSTVRVANKVLQDMFELNGRTAGLAQADVFASAGVKPREWAAFLARMAQLNAEPAEIDESEWELATDPLRIVQRYSAPMRSLAGEVVGRVEAYTDVTEPRRLYTQLLNSERLRAIGEMASGVAHDFNNLLASIVGQTDLLHLNDLPLTTQLAIGTIRQAALDGARMVRNLQGMARPRAETPSTAADVNETVLLAVEMARPRWAGAALHGRGTIDVRLNLADAGTLARLAIDPAELREVLLNLFFNAADALPDGGRIEISTRLGRTRGTVELEVRDTGLGMPESVRARIFEPFFSTKGPKGSGLGLAVAFSIITRHRGEIKVESRVGVGTTFTIRLPYAPVSPSSSGGAVPKTQTLRRAESARAAAVTGTALKGARILVIDDEPGLVSIVRQLMERSGAVVTIAHGGQAALTALQVSDANYDVVITDLDMPEVDGWAVAAAVKARKPGTHVVMLTGWAGEIAPEDFKKRGIDVVLAKPFSRVELEAAIASLLAPQSATGLDILLVDDEAAIARAIRELIGLQGHQVTVVSSVDKAIEAVAAHTFDVVLTDYQLGAATGADLAEQLADGPAPPYVILITGYATEIDDPTLMSRGISAVLPKPCRGTDIRQVLARVSASE